MLNSKESLRKRLHIVSAFLIFIGFYTPTLLAVVLAGEEHISNPMIHLKYFFTSSILWRLGILLSATLMAIGFYIVIRLWKDQLYEDKLGKKRTFSLDYQPYGDAHWAEPCEYSDMAKVRPIEDCKGTILGQLTLDGSQCIDMFKPPRINKHVLAIGSSGSGKSFSLVEPYIMQAVKQRHSIVVTDPKGELYHDTAGYLQDQGYIVRRLDLITLLKSDGWDCMKFLRTLEGDELETNAQIFASIIVYNANLNSSDGVYIQASIALLKALVLYTILNKDPEFEGHRDIRKVNELLHQPNEATYLKSKFEADGFGLYMQCAQNAYRTFSTASENLHGNIITNLAANIQLLQTHSVETILCTDDIDLNMPGDVPCAYYCRFSATNNVFRFVSALFFSMLFISLIDHADRNENKKLKVPVDFVMDEFPSIGKIPDWLEKISNIRSYGITAVMIVQGMSQIRGVYGDDAIMIIGNCGTILNIGMNDLETAQWFQDRIGSTSIVVSTEQIEKNTQVIQTRGILGRESRGVGRDYLISVSDIFNMPVDDELVVFQHCNPIYAHKVPITMFPELSKARKINDEDIPDLGDVQRRREAREEEQRRIAEYYATHPDTVQEETEDYEEPVDFSQMGTLELLWMVVKADIKAIRKVRNEYRLKHGKAPLPEKEPEFKKPHLPSLKRKKEEPEKKAPSAETEQKPAPTPARQPASASFHDFFFGDEDLDDEPEDTKTEEAPGTSTAQEKESRGEQTGEQTEDNGTPTEEEQKGEGSEDESQDSGQANSDNEDTNGSMDNGGLADAPPAPDNDAAPEPPATPSASEPEETPPSPEQKTEPVSADADRDKAQRPQRPHSKVEDERVEGSINLSSNYAANTTHGEPRQNTPKTEKPPLEKVDRSKPPMGNRLR